VPLGRFARAAPLAGTRLVAPGVRAAADARVDPGAIVEAPAFVGARCTVPAGARVKDAILWEGTALAPGEVVEHAIAAGSTRVAA